MSLYTSQCNMKCTGLCIHDTILNSYRAVVSVSVPSFNGSHKGRSGQKNAKRQRFSPVWRPSKPLKIRHLSACCPINVENGSPNDLSATKIQLQGHSRSDTCCLHTSQNAVGEHHLIVSAPLTLRTYTINMTKE